MNNIKVGDTIFLVINEEDETRVSDSKEEISDYLDALEENELYNVEVFEVKIIKEFEPDKIVVLREKKKSKVK